MQSDCKVYVKQFPGATVECMKDYITRKSYHFILHVGTNDWLEHGKISRAYINIYWKKIELDKSLKKTTTATTKSPTLWQVAPKSERIEGTQWWKKYLMF